MDVDAFVYATLCARIYARISILLNSTLSIIAVVLRFSGDVVVYWSNFSKDFQDDVLVKNNYSDPLTLRDVQGFFNAKIPGHEAFQNESTRISGSKRPSPSWRTAFNPALTRVPKRFAVSIFASILLYASPPLQFLSTFAASLVLTWQQDLDFPALIRLSYFSFALFYPLHMLVYTAIELLEPRRKRQWWDRVPDCPNNEIIPVAPFDDLCEYLCLLVITLFSLLEWTDVWNLHVTVVENPEELAMVNRKLGFAMEEDVDDA